MDEKKIVPVEEIEKTEDLNADLGFEFTDETLDELTNGKGDDE